MVKKLIIVGNGFDLARELKTKYSDFFNWLDQNKPKNDFSSFWSTMNYKDADLLYQLEPLKDQNFWYIYMSMLRLPIKDWNDVESRILYVVKSIEESNSLDFLSSTSPSETFSQNDINTMDPEKFALICILFTFCKNKSFDDCHDYLFLELQKFENLFKEYLTDEIGSANFTNFGLNQLKENFEIDDIAILNFNYTNISDIFLEENTRNIHGNAFNCNDDEHLIFGVDSTEISASQKTFRFTKTSRVMHESISHSYNSILSHDIQKISFIGHSLSDADYGYFESIFDYLSIYDADVELNFLYTRHHKENASEMTSYQNAIQRLLETYGNTLENKNKGKNLLQKLLLENRLKLVELR
ncbi:hypothetical protein LTWDN19_19050 [Latilactobacillus curvatus]|uniref:Bacteriophage abortive infection AbiH n=1 Tax=Latilactobacillus curvatus TaxID=28038 RepID=A0ABN6GLP1_LATCU|nr:AbiH family protein [Latilactobacillus curvatus]BCX31338.1 hypothetical protein LTWDN19_19050 [Latilactobacillus curvatus]